MLRFAVRRILLLIPVLFGLSVLLFLWLRALPGDPARALLGEKATPEAIARINEQYGFNKPILQQYLTYVGQLARGDFGSSPRTGEPVVETFLLRFPATIELAVAALLFAVVVGIPLGYLAAKRAGGLIDTLTVSASLAGVVIPVFVLAYLLKVVFAVGLPGWEWLAVLPSSGRQTVTIDATHVTNFYVLDGLLTSEFDAAWDAVKHLILPAIALGSIPLAIIVRMTRASVLDVLHEDYVRTAKAKGLPPRKIILRHALKPAMLPVISYLGPAFVSMITGSVVIDMYFSTGGIGRSFVDAALNRDYSVMMGVTILVGALTIFFNLVVDILYAWIDPKIRY